MTVKSSLLLSLGTNCFRYLLNLGFETHLTETETVKWPTGSKIWTEDKRLLDGYDELLKRGHQ